MSQNGKRKASFEELQEPSNKRQRLGELEHAANGANTTVPPNLTGQTTTTGTAVPANVTGPPTTTIYGNIAGQAAPRGQIDISQAPPGQTFGNVAGVGGAVDSNERARAAPQARSVGPKRKRRASSPATEEPSAKQSARGQKRAGLQEAGLNDKERGTVQESKGQLYCIHPVDKKWAPAVFHNAIRADLIAAASARGSYSVKRTKGALQNDETSYLESQGDWSGDRQHWPRIRHNVLNRHERNGWPDDYHGQRAQVWIHTDGRMVIDHDRNPMYRHPDLPDTLSSAIEGWYLEAVMRLDSRILRETIRARLPDARRPPKSKKSESESMYALTAISNKRLRFRHDEGLVAWDPRAVSTEMNNYFRSFIPQASLDRNSNEGGRGLSKAEREHGESLGKGKESCTKKRGTTSSSTTSPDQRTAPAPSSETQNAAADQGWQSAYGGSVIPRAENLLSPSPSTHANGQQFHLGHQAHQAFDPCALPFPADEGLNPYQSQVFEPIPSPFNQGNIAAHGNAMWPPRSNETVSMDPRPSTHRQNDRAHLGNQPRQNSGPQHREQPRNSTHISKSNATPRPTNYGTAKAGGARRGRARWRNDDPPVYNGAAVTPIGGRSAGDSSKGLGHPATSNGVLRQVQSTLSPAGVSDGEHQRPSSDLTNNPGTESLGRSSSVTGVIPQSNGFNGDRRIEGSVQQTTQSVQEMLAPNVNYPLVDDGLGLQLGDNPFFSQDGWPTELDFELLDWPEPDNTNIDPCGPSTRLGNHPNGIAGPSSTTRVYYDDSAPLQGGQENSVWILDDNGNWLLDDVPGETIPDQSVIAPNNTANRHPQAETDKESLAATSTSPRLYQTGETGISIGEAPVPTAPSAHHPAQPTPSSTAINQPSMAENSTVQQAAPADNASQPSRDIPSTSGNESAQPSDDSGPRYAIPRNHFQYATIQTLLEPTRRAFRSAFQEDSWRDYIPRNYVPPTDRSLSYQGVFEQLSVDFWEVWTSRFGYDAEVPLLATPSRIDEFSAAVLMGLPGL